MSSGRRPNSGHLLDFTSAPTYHYQEYWASDCPIWRYAGDPLRPGNRQRDLHLHSKQCWWQRYLLCHSNSQWIATEWCFGCQSHLLCGRSKWHKLKRHTCLPKIHIGPQDHPGVHSNGLHNVFGCCAFLFHYLICVEPRTRSAQEQFLSWVFIQKGRWSCCQWGSRRGTKVQYEDDIKWAHYQFKVVKRTLLLFQTEIHLYYKSCIWLWVWILRGF